MSFFKKEDCRVPYPMIDALAGQWMFVNGRQVQAQSDQAKPLFIPSRDRMYYEVIRVVQGVPLFLEDHLRRLRRSVEDAFPVPETLEDESRKLILENGIDEANLRIVLTAKQWVVHLAPSYYPDETTQREGVVTGLLNWERPDPNTKIIYPDYKKAVAKRFAEPGPRGSYFEVLLADREGYLTEGSRTNLFFIQDRTVISAPDNRILLGITRQYVQKAIDDTGLTLQTGLLKLEDVRHKAQAAFLSGSPIDVLPIRAIESVDLPSATHPVFQALRDHYMGIVQAYIDARKTGQKAAVGKDGKEKQDQPK
jgi:branched-chain amino acid aminotransferase